ncbi:hypothetical protein Tco_0529626 [Tanacetum coccineum]
MTASMCHKGTGKADFARVHVEIEVSKGYVDNIMTQYKDVNNSIKKTKNVKVRYSWKPYLCKHYEVFSHKYKICENKPKGDVDKEMVGQKLRTEVNRKEGDDDGFREVKNKKAKAGNKGYANNGRGGSSKSQKDSNDPVAKGGVGFS